MTVCSFRPAIETDLPAVLTLAGEAGGSANLASALWERWLAGEEGELTVGEMDGEVVALGKLGVVGDREGWLDLQYIAQVHRQQGLTLALTTYQTEQAAKAELRVLRWAVGSGNTAGQRIAAKAGFHRVAVCAPFISEPLGAGAPTLTVLSERHYSSIQNWLGRSSILRACGGLCATGCRMQDLTGKLMHALLSAGQVVGLAAAEGSVAAFAILGGAASETCGAGAVAKCQVGYLDGEWKSLQQISLALRGLAWRQAQSSIRIMLTDEPTLRGILQSAGFREEQESRSLWIYERVLA
jgi:hypothetical protein